jgi:hypothetical protein
MRPSSAKTEVGASGWSPLQFLCVLCITSTEFILSIAEGLKTCFAATFSHAIWADTWSGATL